jgi:hypothetical protein
MLLVTPTVRLFDTCVHTNSLLPFLVEPEFDWIDLSEVIKLKDVVFRLTLWRVECITATLKTITPKHRNLRQIMIDVSHHSTLLGANPDVGGAVGAANHGQWLDLDRILVRFWESSSVRPVVVCTTERGIGDCIGFLLPEITRRGIIDLIED